MALRRAMGRPPRRERPDGRPCPRPHRTKEEITLRNRITIRVHTASFRSVRGYTVVAALLDEVAFWRSEDSANPDIEIVAALRPAMATVPEPLLLGISSPYARRGVLWEAFKTYYGQDSPVLVWKAPTRSMNPTISEVFVAAELEKDEAAARAEYLAEFRTDIESFLRSSSGCSSRTACGRSSATATPRNWCANVSGRTGSRTR